MGSCSRRTHSPPNGTTQLWLDGIKEATKRGIKLRTPFGKTRKVEDPYAIYRHENSDFEWRVLKTYQHPEKEVDNVYARWFVAAKSPYTHGSWEMGDTYTRDILTYGTLQEATYEWKELYTGKP